MTHHHEDFDLYDNCHFILEKARELYKLELDNIREAKKVVKPI